MKFLNQNLILMEHSTTPQSNWFKLQQSTQNCKKKKKKNNRWNVVEIGRVDHPHCYPTQN